jgi:hypothetical protein
MPGMLCHLLVDVEAVVVVDTVVVVVDTVVVVVDTVVVVVDCLAATRAAISSAGRQETSKTESRLFSSMTQII